MTAWCAAAKGARRGVGGEWCCQALPHPAQPRTTSSFTTLDGRGWAPEPQGSHTGPESLGDQQGALAACLNLCRGHQGRWGRTTVGPRGRLRAPLRGASILGAQSSAQPGDRVSNANIMCGRGTGKERLLSGDRAHLALSGGDPVPLPPFTTRDPGTGPWSRPGGQSRPHARALVSARSPSDWPGGNGSDAQA